tara:strand:- start:8985 stop:9176 length:192 start_codon:yes stop_codon:yes gene_type:complete
MKYIALLLLAGCCSGKCINVEIKAGGDVIMGEECEKCPVAPAIRKKIMEHKSKARYNMQGQKL